MGRRGERLKEIGKEKEIEGDGRKGKINRGEKGKVKKRL